MRVVLDASVIIKWLFFDPDREEHTLRATDLMADVTGGRVLCVVGLGADVAAAQQRAYQGVARIRWTDHYYRRDIGHRAIGRR